VDHHPIIDGDKMNTFKEIRPLCDEVNAEMEIERIAADQLDCCIKIDGEFYIDGKTRKTFCQKLSELIEKYKV